MEKTIQQIPFLRPVITLATGIFFASKIELSQSAITIFLFAALFILGLLLFVNKHYKHKYTSIFGAGITVLFFCLGMISFVQYNNNPTFYENGSYFATVLESPQNKENSYKSVLKTDRFYDSEQRQFIKTNEKILVYFERNTNVLKLSPGDKIIFTQTPQPVKNNGNPYEFDYKRYLERKKIYRQVYLSSDNWRKTDLKRSSSLLILAERTRNKLLNIYNKQNLGENETEILSALTLGYKRELDPEVKRVFSSAGAMHVLAVSGLHVGIIYWILLTFLGFLKKNKSGRLFFVLISVFCLWAYAFITGLSPSVMRATTMFSFIVIGDGIKRTGNIYNSLAASALILLLINPNNLFEVGFQLSYAAVFGIVYIQPKISQIAKVENRILNYFWILITVSVAAQIATFPISVFYFNQFPTYFFISNLFVIPAVFLLIPLGIFLLSFSSVPFLSGGISFLINNILSGTYFLLKGIENLPFAVQKFTIDPIQLFIIIGFLFSVLMLLKIPKISYLKSALIFILLLTCSSFIKKIESKKINKIIVYSGSENPIIHLIAGKTNYVITEQKLENEDYGRNYVDNTVTKLNLHKPLYLTSDTSYKDDDLFLDKDLIFFEGKIITTHKTPTDLLSHLGQHPDFVVNPVSENNWQPYVPNSDIIVTLRRLIPNDDSNSNQIFNVLNQGAFQKNW